MPVEPLLADRIDRIREEEHPAVDGQEHRDHAEHEGVILRDPEGAFGREGVADSPETHVEEEVLVRPRQGILREDQAADREQDRRHDEVAGEMSKHVGRRERTRPELDRERASRAVDRVAHGSRGDPQNLLKSRRRSLGDRDDSIPEAEAGGARGVVDGNDPVVGGEEESRERLSDVGQQQPEQHDEQRRAPRDQQREARGHPRPSGSGTPASSKPFARRMHESHIPQGRPSGCGS